MAPSIGVPFLFHWYVIGSLPVAATVNVAICPILTACDEGWAVMVMAWGAGVGAGTALLAPPQPAHINAITAATTKVLQSAA